MDNYEGVEDEAHFLSTEERQNIVYQILLNVRAVQGESLGTVKFLEVPLLQTANIVSAVFPLHDNTMLSRLRRAWVQTLSSPQPLDEICEYFGVKIAMYFAYLGHYTSLLTVPTVLGIVVWFLQAESQMIEDLCFVFFGLFNVFWATLFVELWQRRSSELAFKWGTLDKKGELLQDPRPLYTGELVISPVTGRLEPHYPAWKQNLFFYFVSLPTIIMCLLVVFYIMLVIFELQEWINDLVQRETVPSWVYFVPKILLAIVISGLDEVYKKIAIWLNDKENYRMEEKYENHLVIKLVLFQFVNSFLSLFYIAFYIQDMDRLRDQLATQMITRQVLGNLREALLPYILWKMKLVKVGYDITGRMSPTTLEREIQDMTEEPETPSYTAPPRERFGADDSHDGEGERHYHVSELVLTQAEVESTMKTYEDTFDDYLEMFIQYGYVILFSSAFPLAALCALLNNFIEIRTDAFKLCLYHQRPFGRRVQNIGIWQDALRAMSVVAVVVNSALIGVSGQLTRLIPGLNTVTVIIIIIAFEHAILVLKMCVSYAIPSQPQWINQEMSRLEFQRRDALKRMEMSNPPSAFSTPLPEDAPNTPRRLSKSAFSFTRPPVPVRHHTSALSKLSSVLHQDSPTTSTPQSAENSSKTPSGNTTNQSQDIDSQGKKTVKKPMDNFRHHPNSVLQQPDTVRYNDKYNSSVRHRHINEKPKEAASQGQYDHTAQQSDTSRKEEENILKKTVPKKEEPQSYNTSVFQKNADSSLGDSTNHSSGKSGLPSAQNDKTSYVSTCSIDLKSSASTTINSNMPRKSTEHPGQDVANGIPGGDVSRYRSDKYERLGPLTQHSLRDVIRPSPITMYSSSIPLPHVRAGSHLSDMESRVAARQRILQNVRGRQAEMGSPNTRKKPSTP